VLATQQRGNDPGRITVNRRMIEIDGGTVLAYGHYGLRGHDVPHDWPSWRRQIAHRLPRFV
jgi:hypothetical protein